MSQILYTSTMHKTASLADEGNYAYCQSRVAHNIKRTYESKQQVLLPNKFITF